MLFTKSKLFLLLLFCLSTVAVFALSDTAKQLIEKLRKKNSVSIKEPFQKPICITPTIIRKNNYKEKVNAAISNELQKKAKCEESIKEPYVENTNIRKIQKHISKKSVEEPYIQNATDSVTKIPVQKYETIKYYTAIFLLLSLIIIAWYLSTYHGIDLLDLFGLFFGAVTSVADVWEKCLNFLSSGKSNQSFLKDIFVIIGLLILLYPVLYFLADPLLGLIFILDIGLIGIFIGFYEKQFGWEISKKRTRYISQNVKHEVFSRDNGSCSYCGSTTNLEYDHIQPYCKGGSSDTSNIQLLCRTCNRRKKDKW